MNTFNGNPSQIPSRPKLLVFLCYLTMFGSGLAIMQTFSTIGNPEQVSIEFTKNFNELHVQFEEALKNDAKTLTQIDDLFAKVDEVNTSSNMRDNSIFSLISNVLTWIGAMLMLRLKRNGFKFYVLGTIIGIVAPLVVFGGTNLLGFAFAFYLFIIGVIFVTLYAFKLKYME